MGARVLVSGQFGIVNATMCYPFGREGLVRNKIGVVTLPEVEPYRQT